MSKGEEKQRRMAIRRDIGNRLPNDPHPGPRAPGRPLTAHACFACRKSYKLDPERSQTCPECGGTAHWMGRAFKAPRRRDEKQWAKVERLYEAGFRFHRYGGDYPPIPEHPREVEEFLRRHPDHPLRIGRAV